MRTEGTRAASDQHYLLPTRVALTASLGTLFLLLAGCGGEDDGAAKPSAADEIARVEASASGGGSAVETEALPVIVFLGTSLTAGYGLEESQAYPALIEERLRFQELEPTGKLHGRNQAPLAVKPGRQNMNFELPQNHHKKGLFGLQHRSESAESSHGDSADAF